MTAGTVLFWILASSATLGAIAVVVSQNVVRMAFWLIVALGSTAGLFFLLHADFVAATQILVYVGGTVVLLIFGVMLTASGPFSKLKMSPGNLIAVASVGALVFFLMYQSVNSVNWDGTVLRQIAISEAHRSEILKSDADEENRKLLESAFRDKLVTEITVPHKHDEHEGHEETGDHQHSQEFVVYKYSPEAKLDQKQETALLTFLKTKNLSFAPSTKTGGTIRPLGFGLLGSRPDRDLGTPRGLERLSDGFYVEKAKSKANSQPAISTGYLLPFEIASVHLLVVLIGAAYLARAKRRVDPNS